MPGTFWKDINKLRYISAALVFAIAFTVYFCTMAPTVTLVDSGELILASAGLGVAHPPGFPLYVMLAHLASLVPIGNIAVRIHAASALFAALAAALMTLLVVELMLATPLITERKPKKKKEKSDPNDTPATAGSALSAIVPALLTGLLFAFSRTLWSYATIAEVYTLNSLLIVAILWLIFAWRREFRSDEPVFGKLYIAALIFGLAMGVHHVTTAFFLPSLALLVLTTAGKRFFTSKHFLFAGLISIAGLVIVYTYLPLAASRGPILNWTDPRSLEGIWRHISGRQYQGYFGFASGRLNDLVVLFTREFGVVWLPVTLLVSAAGLVDRFRRSRREFWFVALVVMVDVLYCLFNGSAEDKDAYYLPAFISLIAAAAYGMRWLIDNARQTVAFLTPARAATALLAVPVIAFASNLPYNGRHGFYVAHDYVDNIFASVEPRGMLLTSDWQAYSPSLYVREIEGERKDIVFVDIKLLKQSWYFGYLDKAYPEMMDRLRDKANLALEDMRASERDPGAYERNMSLKQRLAVRFQDFYFSLVNDQMKNAPLYLTAELADTKSGQDMGLLKMLQERYDLVPQGLVFRVTDKGSVAVVVPPEITTRGLNDGTIKFEADDVVRKSVIPVYTAMLTNTGMYLASKGAHDRAVTVFQEALAVDPAYDAAKKGLAASGAALPH